MERVKKLIRYEISITLFMEDMDETEALDYIQEKVEELTTHDKAGFSTATIKPIHVSYETGEPE